MGLIMSALRLSPWNWYRKYRRLIGSFEIIIASKPWESFGIRSRRQNEKKI